MTDLIYMKLFIPLNRFIRMVPNCGIIGEPQESLNVVSYIYPLKNHLSWKSNVLLKDYLIKSKKRFSIRPN